MTKEEFIKLDDVLNKYFALSKRIETLKDYSEKITECISGNLTFKISTVIDGVGRVDVDDFGSVDINKRILQSVLDECNGQIEKLKKEIDELSVENV